MREFRADPLSEIDKISSNNFHGDPAAAMLEVLDPEQNWKCVRLGSVAALTRSFNDHYIGVGMDLSQVLFVATANTLETISPPLMDRMEVIQLSGYIFDEKAAIGRKYLCVSFVRMYALRRTPCVLPLCRCRLSELTTPACRSSSRPTR